MTETNTLAPIDPSPEGFDAWYGRQCQRSDDAKNGVIRAWTKLAWQAARRAPAPASQPVAVPAGMEPVACVHKDTLAMLNSRQVRPWEGGVRLYPANYSRFYTDYVGVFTAAQVQAMLAASSSGPVREPLCQLEAMRIVMDVERTHNFLRGTTNWACAVVRAIESAHGINAAQKEDQ